MIRYTLTIWIMGLLSLCMGIVALYMSFKAKKMLSQGIINKYISFYISSVIIIMLFTILYTIRKLFGLQYLFFESVEYYLLTASFFSLVLVSYRTLHIGKTFGFQNFPEKRSTVDDKVFTVPITEKK